MWTDLFQNVYSKAIFPLFNTTLSYADVWWFKQVFKIDENEKVIAIYAHWSAAFPSFTEMEPMVIVSFQNVAFSIILLIFFAWRLLTDMMSMQTTSLWNAFFVALILPLRALFLSIFRTVHFLTLCSFGVFRKENILNRLRYSAPVNCDEYLENSPRGEFKWSYDEFFNLQSTIQTTIAYYCILSLLNQLFFGNILAARAVYHLFPLFVNTLIILFATQSENEDSSNSISEMPMPVVLETHAGTTQFNQALRFLWLSAIPLCSVTLIIDRFILQICGDEISPLMYMSLIGFIEFLFAMRETSHCVKAVPNSHVINPVLQQPVNFTL